jgi:hypothetical protein
LCGRALDYNWWARTQVSLVCGQMSFVEFVGERCKEMVLVQTFDHTCGSDWCILHADTVIKESVGVT